MDIAEIRRVLLKYPDRIPILLERDPKASFPEFDKRKFLCPTEITLSQFVAVLRKRIKMRPEKALFIFVGDTLPNMNKSLGEIYDKHKNKNNYLILKVCDEATFG